MDALKHCSLSRRHHPTSRSSRRFNLSVLVPMAAIRHHLASLTFTTQKNGVRGEVISLACSGDPVLCPVQALIWRVLYQRQHSAPLATPIARVFNSASSVTSSIFTMIIWDSVSSLGLALGFLPTDVLAQCLRATGTTALLLAQVDPNIIRLIGRWHSNKMLQYLHVQAYPLMKDYNGACLLLGTMLLFQISWSLNADHFTSFFSSHPSLPNPSYWPMAAHGLTALGTD
jgi:hypothetical protein